MLAALCSKGTCSQKAKAVEQFLFELFETERGKVFFFFLAK